MGTYFVKADHLGLPLVMTFLRVKREAKGIVSQHQMYQLVIVM